MCRLRRGKEQVSALQPLLLPLLGLNLVREGKRGRGAVVGLCMWGNLCHLGSPLPPKPPLSPLLLLLFLRYLILFPATQLHPKAGARKLSDGDNNLTLK